MIKTRSKFVYGFDVDSTNFQLSFKEGSTEKTAAVEFGNYTVAEGLTAVTDALNAAGDNTYQVEIDRSTGVVTISADADFDILLSTGSADTTIHELLGFTQGSDLTGSDTYAGAGICGEVYYPQFLLQDYTPPEHFVESIEATVNRSASGRVEVVTFGQESKIEFNLKYITSLPMDGQVILNSATGREDAIAFLNYVSKKKRFEFFPDRDADSLYKVIAESLPGYSKGTGFKLRMMPGLFDIYETGSMQLRVVT